MKYALLNHLPLEQFEARKDPALISAWKSYVEAIQASGVLMESVGLQPPDKATMVSVRSGKRHVRDGPYAESKELLGGLLMFLIWTRPWNGRPAARPPDTAQSRFVHCGAPDA
jgi:hypothetical protein